MRARHSRRSRKFKIRRAGLRDIEVLVRHRRGMWQSLGVADKAALDNADRVYRRWARARMHDGTLLGWVAMVSNGGIAASGCLWLQPIQPPLASYRKDVQPYLFSMYTEPIFRRNGLSSRIVKEAMKWCKKKGYPRLSLHASKMGRRIYRELGFARTWEMRIETIK
jgi:GNAT superfamily N-acetyltransferase